MALITWIVGNRKKGVAVKKINKGWRVQLWKNNKIREGESFTRKSEALEYAHDKKYIMAER